MHGGERITALACLLACGASRRRRVGGGRLTQGLEHAHLLCAGSTCVGSDQITFFSSHGETRRTRQGTLDGWLRVGWSRPEFETLLLGFASLAYRASF